MTAPCRPGTPGFLQDCPDPYVRRTDFGKTATCLKNWWVVTPIAATGVRIPNTTMVNKGLPAVWTLDTMGYAIDVPSGHILWSLSVDYPSANGNVFLNLNNGPVPVRTGVLFNLSRDEFPCGIVGPVTILIMDPADDVNFEALIAEE